MRASLFRWINAGLLLYVGNLTAYADSASKQALFVGISDYPFLEKQQQLSGASRDLAEMSFIAKHCGFQVTQLRGPQATLEAIRRTLTACAGRAQAGEEIVFYFTGRGSVAFDPSAPGRLENMEPTLVPYDADKEDAKGDLRIGFLEKWAEQLRAKGVGVTLIVDACFTTPTGTRGPEDRQYNPVPRCVFRRGQPRAELYQGPGVFLCATNSRGRAYEWDLSLGRWMGAFTSELTDRVKAALAKEQRPTYAALMQELRSWFSDAKRCDYMPGQLPYASQEAKSKEYEQRLFAYVPSPPPTHDQKSEMVRQDAERKEREKTLRVALDTPPGALEKKDRQTLLQSVSREMQEYLAKNNLTGITLLSDGAARPDRYVIVNRTDGMLTAAVTGDEIEAQRNPHFSGASSTEVMDKGLSAYLERQALVLRLFRMTEEADKGTLKPGEWAARSGASSYKRGGGEVFKYVVDMPIDGLVYVLDQDADGIVQMTWPMMQAPNNRLEQGKSRELTVAGWEIGSDVPIGKTLSRAVVVLPNAALPMLEPPGGGRWESDTAYSRAELKHLRALMEALESGKAKWAACTFYYEVLKGGD